MGVKSLPKTVTRQRRGSDLNLGPTAPESRTLTTRLPSHKIDTLNNTIEGLYTVVLVVDRKLTGCADTCL